MRIHTASQQTISLWLPGRAVPKARPRVTRGRAYLPSGYREWRRVALLEILCQLGDRTSLPLRKASVEILLSGKHRGDADNIAGSILDVLVEAQVITDDRLSCLPKIVIEHQPLGEIGAKITIQELL